MFQGSIELSKYSPNLSGLRTMRDLCQSRVSDQNITLIPKRCKAQEQRVEVEEDETQKTRAKTL